MANALRIGLAGLGNVGVGVLDILKKHESLLANRAGSAIKVTAVSARTKGKNRGHDLSAMQWFDSPQDLAKSADIDVFVELIGGEGDPAKSAVLWGNRRLDRDLPSLVGAHARADARERRR